MSKAKQELIRRIAERLGQNPSVGDVVDELYSTGILDDVLCHKAVVMHDFYTMCAATTMSASRIMNEVMYAHDLPHPGIIRYVVNKRR